MHVLVFRSTLHLNFGRHYVTHAWARNCKAPRGTSLLALFEVPTARDKQSLALDLHIVDALVDESLREATGCATEAFDVGGGRQATDSGRRATGNGTRAASGWRQDAIGGRGGLRDAVGGRRAFVFGHPNWNQLSPCTRKYQ